jgi:hypothetical protein
MVIIYKLVDSRFPDVCLYVGKTKGTMSARMSAHKSTNFNRILPYKDKEYVIIVFIETCNEEDVHQREGFWINELKAIYNRQLSSWRNKIPLEKPYVRRTNDAIIFGLNKVERSML